MQVVIDRFEGDMAVCEKPDRTMLNIPRSQLPTVAREGDVLVIDKNRILIAALQTSNRRKAAQDKLKRLRPPDNKS